MYTTYNTNTELYFTILYVEFRAKESIEVRITQNMGKERKNRGIRKILYGRNVLTFKMIWTYGMDKRG